MDKELKRKKSIIIIGIISTMIILLGSAYAFFTYSKASEAFTLTNGNIEASFTGGTNSVNFQNAYPISDQFALENLNNLTYIDFTVSSNVTNSNQAVSYEVYLEEDPTNTLSSDYVKLYLTESNNNEIQPPVIYSNLENTTYTGSSNGKVIYKDNNSGEFTKDFRLYVWLDSSYTQNDVSQTFSFKVNLYAYNDENKRLSYVFKNAIVANTTDSCKTYIEEDGITYISGSKDCIDFNYVWYSGKLWRITAINADGSLKLITEDLITSITWGSDTTYSTSWMREWLNQEFLPTLYNYENIIDTDAGWYSITDSATPPTKPTGEYTLTDSVGLLNAYEYYMSYKNTSDSNGYLNIGYPWWLITPYDSSSVRQGFDSDIWIGDSNVTNCSRPSINLKSTIQLVGGSGKVNDPYRINGDQEEIDANVTLLNTRQSGEYVKLSSDETAPIFRIVDTELVGETLTTKIVLNDYVKESDTILTKYFSGSNSHELWSEVSATDPTYWRGYLNTTWLETLDTNMLEKGIYYLGYYFDDSYKTTVCSTVSSDVSVKQCIENGTVVSNKVTDDYVGLLRVGEMFASQTRDYTYRDAENIWLVSPYDSSYVWYVGYQGFVANNIPSSYSYGVRPSINLKSTILIKSGSGTKQDPYVVGLPSSE